MKNPFTPMKSSAKDVFSYLLMIIMLYVGIFAFIALLWQYVNVQFPDALNYYYSSATDTIRRSIASLVVVWPVFLGMSWLIYKDIRENPEKRDLWVRKWSLYLTLFIAAITIVVDLIMLLYNFLGGELTTRFALKVAVVLIVAIGVFGYYFWDLRRESFDTSKKPMLAAVKSSVLILAAIIAGFFIVGTPAEQRAVRLDEQRISNLMSIQSEILGYWSREQALPESLSDITGKHVNQGYFASISTDPVTEQPYVYQKTAEHVFELCATFDATSEEVSRYHAQLSRPMYRYEQATGLDNWDHEAGYFCFERTIDPDMYPPVKE